MKIKNKKERERERVKIVVRKRIKEKQTHITKPFFDAPLPKLSSITLI